MKIRSKYTRNRKIFARHSPQTQRALIEAIEPRILMSAAQWTGTAGDGNWATPGNWLSGAVPSSGDTVDFPSLGAPATITLSTDVTIDGLTIEGQYTLTGQTITLAGSLSSTSSTATINSGLALAQNTTVTVGSSDTLTATAITGSFNLTKTGAGTLVLAGSGVTYSGTTTLSAGTLEVDTTLNSSVTAASGTTLTGSGTANGITSAGATISLAAASGTGLTLTAMSTISVASGNILTYNSISGIRAFTKTGTGTLVLSAGGNLSSYTKIITVSAGTLEADTALGGTVSVLSGATLDGSGTAPTIDVNGGTISIAASGSVVLQANSTISVASGNTLTLTSMHNSGGLFGFTKTGAGTLVLSGSSFNYGGNNTLTDGTLEVDAALQSSITVNSGTLDGSGSAYGIYGNGGTISLAIQSGFGLVLQANSTINVGLGSTLSYNSVSGSYNISKTGSGTLVFPTGGTYSGYTGTTEVAAGTLEVDAPLASSVTVDAGATLNGSGTADGITGAGGTISVAPQTGSALTLVADSTIEVDSSNTLSFDTIAGTYNVTKTGTGTLIFSDAGSFSNYNGNTEVAAGTLEVDTPLNDGVTVDVGATLDGSGTTNGIIGAGGTISIAAQSGSGLTLVANSTISVGSGDTLSYNQISGSYNITKTGLGTLVFKLGGSFSSYNGNTTVAGGTLDVEAQLNDGVTLDTATTLDGGGTVGGIVDDGGTLALTSGGSPSQLTSSAAVSLGSGSTLAEGIASQSNGQLIATGSSIDLTGATLNVSLLNGYSPPLGTVITLISNQTGSAITGTFSGLAQGAMTNVSGVNFQISYTGGLGHDVALTVAPDQWTGAASDGNWNTAGNWLSGVVPASGDSVVFPAHGGGLTDISLGSNVTVGDITFNDNYYLTNDTITLDGNITSNSSEILVQSNLLLTHDTTMTSNTGDGLILYAIGDGGDHYGITEQGGGTLSLVQNSTYTGPTVVTAGTLNDNLALDSVITVDSGATLDAPTSFGATAGITDNGGTIELGQGGSPGQLTVSGAISLGSGSTFQEDIVDHRMSGERDGLLVATGLSTSINLTGSTLAVSLQGNATPSLGDVFTLISNQTGNAITGTFSGLPQNAITNINGLYYQVSYTGGAGGDVTLTVVAPPVASQLVFAQEPNGATAGQSIGTVVVDVEDQYGSIFTGDSSPTVTLAGLGLTGTSSATASDGAATFAGLSMTTASAQRLTATDGSLASANSSSITISPASANKLVFSTEPNNAVAGASIGTVAVTVEDQFGNTLTSDSSSSVTLAGTGLTGTLAANASGGIATFTGLSMTQAGSYTLLATDGNLTTATSNSITITPATASQLVFTTQPNSAIAGASIGTVGVSVEDQYGNIVTSDDSTVTLTGTSLTGTPSAQASGGVATLTGLSMTQAGTRSLSAADGNLTGTSNSITITPAAENQLVFTTQPNNAIAGASIGTVVARVEDQYGNLITTDSSSTVTLAGLSLAGPRSAMASDGVARFGILSMTLAGTRSLTATDGLLAPATSNLIIISPAAAAKLVFSQQPTTGTENQNLGTIAVEIEDAFGNLVTANSSTVTLSASDGTPLGGVSSEAASGGIAIFSTVSIEAFGSHLLSASDGNLPAATSSAIAVAPVLASLTITAPTTTLDQGTNLQLQVSGADPFGTPVALSNVIWSLDAGSPGSIDQDGLLTAGDATGTATVRATCDGQTATFAVTVNGLPVIVVTPYVQQIAPAGNIATLHVQGQQTGTDTSLIYTWSIVNQPAVVSGRLSVGSSPLAVFSVNGTSSAQNTSVTFLASGTYTLQVTASDGIQSASSDVQVTATIKSSTAKTLALTTQVSGVSTVGNTQQITGFVVTFNGPLDAATAQDIRGYRIRRLAGGNTALESAAYNPATYSVTLTLAKPMPFHSGTGMVQVFGSGRYAIRDAQGRLIDGDSNGKPGGTFAWNFSVQVAKTVSYHTAAGDLVKLSLAGPGKIISLLAAGSSAPIITLTGTNLAGSILTGKLRKGRKSLGYVVLDQLNGTTEAEIQLGNEFHVNEYDAGDSQG